MTTVTDRVSASLHDCYDTANGNFPGFSATDVLWFGHDSDLLRMGLIWDGVSIPSGATFDDGCSIQLTDVQFGSYTNPEMDIYGVEEATLTVWSTTDDPDSRTRTTAVVAWVGNWTSASTQTSPEIKTLLQEIGDTVGAITDLTLVLFDPSDGTVDDHDIESFDTSSAEAPFVTIEYTAGGGGEEPAPVRRTLGLMGVGR